MFVTLRFCGGSRAVMVEGRGAGPLYHRRWWVVGEVVSERAPLPMLSLFMQCVVGQ